MYLVTSTTAHNQHRCSRFSYQNRQITSRGSRFPLLHQDSRESSDFVYFLENDVTFIMLVAYLKKKKVLTFVTSADFRTRWPQTEEFQPPLSCPTVSVSHWTQKVKIFGLFDVHTGRTGLCVQRAWWSNVSCVFTSAVCTVCPLVFSDSSPGKYTWSNCKQ